MHIVTFTGEKIELVMHAGAELAIQCLLMAVRAEGGVGLVLPGGESFKLEKHDRDEKEADDIRKNIEAEKPARHDLPWSANDYARLSERFRLDRSTTIESLAMEFERTPAGIRNQLQKMGLVDQYGKESRRIFEPQEKHIYSIRSPTGGDVPIIELM